jgi:mercuric ion transport protein
MKAKFAGIFSVLLATTCCVGPLVLVAIGLGSGAAIVGRYHWLFLIAGTAVLTWAWAKYLREKTVCDCEHKTMQGRRSGMFTLLIATVIVLGFGSLNISRYIFASTLASAQTQTQVANGLNHVVISVDGMSCVTCEIAARHALKQVDGVKSAHASVATKSVTVDYDPAKTNTEQLVAAVNSTGYRASLPDKINDSASMAKNKNTNDTKIGLASSERRRKRGDYHGRSNQFVQSFVAVSGRSADRLWQRFEANSARTGARLGSGASMVKSNWNADRSSLEITAKRPDTAGCGVSTEECWMLRQGRSYQRSARRSSRPGAEGI